MLIHGFLNQACFRAIKWSISSVKPLVIIIDIQDKVQGTGYKNVDRSPVVISLPV